MRTGPVTDLFKELKELRIRQSELIEQLRVLRIKESEIIEQLEAKVTVQDHQQQEETPVNEPPLLRSGARVRITNKVQRPYIWVGKWNPEAIEKYRRGTIIHIQGERIHIRTDLGPNTWRLEKNLELL